MELSAVVVSTGDEILSGTTLDTNSSWLARELVARGARVRTIVAVPDDEERLARQLELAAREGELLVCTGGLGPTEDDCTAAAAGRAIGRPLEEREEAWAQIEERFRAVGISAPSSNRKQAQLPQGATLLENPVGTAPGFALDVVGARAFFFPGVPRELRVMAAQHLWPWLTGRGLAPLERVALHVCGVGESALQDRLADLSLPEGVRLGFKTWLPYNSVILYGSAAGEGAVGALEEARREVRARLGTDCFGEGEETLPAVVGRLLTQRGWQVAVAESCTGGGAGALLTEADGSSAWFSGGVISYSNAVKESHLGVPAAVLEVHGAVSEPCAEAMAQGVRRALNVDVGLSITGIAGPSGGSSEKPVGTVCFGLALPDEVRARTVRFGDRGRDWIRTLAAATAVEWLRRRLNKRDASGE